MHVKSNSPFKPETAHHSWEAIRMGQHEGCCHFIYFRILMSQNTSYKRVLLLKNVNVYSWYGVWNCCYLYSNKEDIIQKKQSLRNVVYLWYGRQFLQMYWESLVSVWKITCVFLAMNDLFNIFKPFIFQLGYIYYQDISDSLLNTFYY